MGRIANVKPVTASVGGKEHTFRSKLEYRYCVYLELLKQAGEIVNWWYEDRETLMEVETAYLHNKKLYLPDFVVQTNTGRYELHECKGFFQQKDAMKLRLAAQQYENPITLIFAGLPAKSKNKKKRAQRERAEKLEPYLKRVIYHADRDIFKKIKGMFEY